MYNVYANVVRYGFGRHFFCSHGLHVLENLCSVAKAKVRKWAIMIHSRVRWEPELRRRNSNGMSFEKKIALHFYLGCRNASTQWTRRLWNRLVPDWMQPTKLMKQGGVSLRRKAETYYGQKLEWRNRRKGNATWHRLYSIPWDVSQRRQQKWQCVVGRNGDKRMRCRSNIHPKLPVRHHVTIGPRGGVLATIVQMGDPFEWWQDGEGRKLFGRRAMRDANFWSSRSWTPCCIRGFASWSCW